MVEAFWRVQGSIGSEQHVWAKDVLPAMAEGLQKSQLPAPTLDEVAEHLILFKKTLGGHVALDAGEGVPVHFGKWVDAYQSIMVDAFWTVQTAVGTGRHVWARDVLAATAKGLQRSQLPTPSLDEVANHLILYKKELGGHAASGDVEGMPACFESWSHAYQRIMADAFWTLQGSDRAYNQVWARDVLAAMAEGLNRSHLPTPSVDEVAEHLILYKKELAGMHWPPVHQAPSLPAIDEGNAAYNPMWEMAVSSGRLPVRGLPTPQTPFSPDSHAGARALGAAMMEALGHYTSEDGRWSGASLAAQQKASVATFRKGILRGIPLGETVSLEGRMVLEGNVLILTGRQLPNQDLDELEVDD